MTNRRCGDFEVVGLALDEFDGFLAEITGEQEFVEASGSGAWRQR